MQIYEKEEKEKVVHPQGFCIWLLVGYFMVSLLLFPY
jgi:hypothetical protein